MYYTIVNGGLLTAENEQALTDYYDNVQPLPTDYEQGKYIVVDNKLVLNEHFEEEKAQERKAQFHKDFFNTSLGFVRRKVSMATGETKDFLSDLLPAITSAVQIGQEVKILTYKEPDYTTDEVDWKQLQEVKIVTPQFVNECVLQLNNDFLPQIEPTVPTEPTTDTTIPEENM